MTSADNLELARKFHSCTLDDYASLMSDNFIGHDILGHDWDREFQIKGLKEDITAFDKILIINMREQFIRFSTN